MVLGLHIWVYCQLTLRRYGGWEHREAALRDLVERQLAQIFREVADAGFAAVETMADILCSEADLAAHAAALETSGLSFLGVSHNAAYWDPLQRSAQVEFLDLVCERVERLGGGHLGLSATPPSGRAKTSADYDEQAETFRAISAVARRHGVTPNLHTYDRDAADDCREIREVVARLGADELALGPDLAWLAAGGADPVEVVRRFGDRIEFVHLRDRTAQGEWAEAAGEGIEDFPALGAALRAVGFNGPAVFEPAFADWAPTRPLVETLSRSAEHLRAALIG